MATTAQTVTTKTAAKKAPAKKAPKAVKTATPAPATNVAPIPAPAAPAPAKVARKEYSPEVKAAALADVASGLKMTKVAAARGISYMTLVGWVDTARKTGGAKVAAALPAVRQTATVLVSKPTGLRIGFTRAGTLFINTGETEVKLEGADIDFLKALLNA